MWLAVHPERLPWVYPAIPPWMVGLVAIVKTAAAIAAFHAVSSLGLWSWRQIAGVFSGWLLFTGCADRAGDPDRADPRHSDPDAAGCRERAALFVPLVRFPLATLALDWNRHR